MTDIDGYQRIFIKDMGAMIDDVQTGIDVDRTDSFALLGNYPNPFNPSTSIEFSLQEAGFAELVIYNVMGQKVRELLSGSMKAGVNSVVWDGRDDFGLTVAAGVYIAKLTMGSSIKARSMMLVK